MGPDGFDMFRRGPFGAPQQDPNAVPDGGAAPGSVAPSGFVDHVENRTTNVRIDETGIHITGGELRVTNPGGTVIIDGSSNMFKIMATGTQNLTVIADAFDSLTTVLSGLGAQSTTPAHLSFLGNLNSVTAARFIGSVQFSTATRYVATTSGGAVTADAAISTDFAQTWTSLDASNFVKITVSCFNRNPGSETIYHTYHILKEAAL